MKNFNSSLLALTFLLSACSGNIAVTENASPADTMTTTASAETTTARKAVLSKIENSVTVRLSSNDQSSPASVGMIILPTGGLETGADGRARLDLLPEGTIVRVGPNSTFTIPQISEENGQPKTTIELLAGKVFILLKGGTLDVQTPSGVASVRGSLLSVEYDPEIKKIAATCLEGHCALEDENGAQVDMTEGEQSYIVEGDPPVDPFQMDSLDIQEWLDYAPELEDSLPELPNPDNFPEESNPPSFDDNGDPMEDGSQLPDDSNSESND